jgi:hypothetical protein
MVASVAEEQFAILTCLSEHSCQEIGAEKATDNPERSTLVNYRSKTHLLFVHVDFG